MKLEVNINTMKKIFKSLLCTAIIGVSMLQNCSAFFLGSDKYTKEEYEKAGITWKHNIILPDKYYFNGKQVNQPSAEREVDSYIWDIKYKADYYRHLGMIAEINQIIESDFLSQNKKIEILKSIYKDLKENPIEDLNHRVVVHIAINKAIEKCTNKNSKVY